MAHKETKENHYSATLGARGRVVLPAGLRERLGVEEGDRLVFTVQEDGGVRLISLREAARGLEGAYAHLATGGSVVDELIAERREEARREGSE